MPAACATSLWVSPRSDLSFSARRYSSRPLGRSGFLISIESPLRMSDKTPEWREPTNTFLVYINSALASCYTVRKCATKGREVNGGGDDKRERGHRPDGGGFLKAAAYKIIRQLNAEFKEGGCQDDPWQGEPRVFREGDFGMLDRAEKRQIACRWASRRTGRMNPPQIG